MSKYLLKASQECFNFCLFAPFLVSAMVSPPLQLNVEWPRKMKICIGVYAVGDNTGSMQLKWNLSLIRQKSSGPKKLAERKLQRYLSKGRGMSSFESMEALEIPMGREQRNDFAEVVKH